MPVFDPHKRSQRRHKVLGHAARAGAASSTAPKGTEATQPLHTSAAVPALSTEASKKALGFSEGDAYPSSAAGARNALQGMGLLDGFRARLKRGVLVAVTGLLMAVQLGNPPLEVHRQLVATTVATTKVTTSVQQERRGRADTHIVATGPPPVGAHPALLHHAPVAVPGRDAPLQRHTVDGAEVSTTTSRGELPDTLLADLRTDQPSGNGAFRVEHGTDPGDYYCEHALFAQQQFAAGVGIVKNTHGEPLVGFLHIPDDAWSAKPPDEPIDLAARYARHATVVGAAFAGYFDQAKEHVRGPVRILVTGYGPFMGVTNNPAGGFVSHKENIDAAMQRGFGDKLLTPSGTPVAPRKGGESGHTMTLRYRVEDHGVERALLITAELLDVADSEFKPVDPGSLIGAMRAVKPHAMLSLGVHGGSAFLVEHHADDGGLAFSPDGSMRHDGSKSATLAFLDNWALARAVHIGAQQQKQPETIGQQQTAPAVAGAEEPVPTDRGV